MKDRKSIIDYINPPCKEKEVHIYLEN